MRVVGRVVAGERLGEVEDEIAIHARQRVQPLGRPVEDVEGRLVPELDERLGDFVLDFFLVERARQRRLVGRTRGGVFRLLPPIVEDDDIQCAHSVARLYATVRALRSHGLQPRSNTNYTELSVLSHGRHGAHWSGGQLTRKYITSQPVRSVFSVVENRVSSGLTPYFSFPGAWRHVTAATEPVRRGQTPAPCHTASCRRARPRSGQRRGQANIRR